MVNGSPRSKPPNLHVCTFRFSSSEAPTSSRFRRSHSWRHLIPRGGGPLGSGRWRFDGWLVVDGESWFDGRPIWTRWLIDGQSIWIDGELLGWLFDTVGEPWNQNPDHETSWNITPHARQFQCWAAWRGDRRETTTSTPWCQQLPQWHVTLRFGVRGVVFFLGLGFDVFCPSSVCIDSYLMANWYDLKVYKLMVSWWLIDMMWCITVNWGGLIGSSWLTDGEIMWKWWWRNGLRNDSSQDLINT